jgi:hypothetical protein
MCHVPDTDREGTTVFVGPVQGKGDERKDEYDGPDSQRGDLDSSLGDEKWQF